MVRPRHFLPNPSTATDNAFQKALHLHSDLEIARNAFDEVTSAAGALKGRGVTVHLFDDDRCDRPDSVFAGNAIELQGRRGRVLALSTTAARALTRQQIATIERTAALVPIHVPTIELAGGSVRCMLAGIHLDTRPAQSRVAAAV